MYKNSCSEYKCLQVFGYKQGNQKIQQDDIISTIKFDQSGEYIAVGDRAGRIILFKFYDNKKKPQFQYYSEFQSHSREFDALQSVETDQEIKAIEWLPSQGSYLKMATANEKQIKVWKIYQKAAKKVSKSSGNELIQPRLQTTSQEVIATPWKHIPNKHQGEIHSLAASFNEEYLLSSDETHTYLWSLEDPNRPFIVAQYSKAKQNNLQEEITCTKLHPIQDNIFVNGTNMGALTFKDLRTSVHEKNSILFESSSGSAKNYCSQLMSSVRSVQMLRGGKYLASRDFLNVKIWDVCNPNRPVLIVKVQQTLKDKICQIFENECIHDQFSLGASSDGNTLLTGNYNNCFHMLDSNDGSNYQYELNYKKNTIVRTMNAKSALPTKMDYKKKLLAVDLSPNRRMLAACSLSCFFVYGC